MPTPQRARRPRYVEVHKPQQPSPPKAKGGEGSGLDIFTVTLIKGPSRTQSFKSMR